MKGKKIILAPAVNTREILKYVATLTPEKKSSCGKCKECKCQLFSLASTLTIEDKRR